MRTLAIAFALASTFAVTLAAAEEPPAATASSVTEMLQRRQDSQRREQLVKEGRWDEVREIDDEHLRRQQVAKKQTITRLNAEFAREGTVDTATNGDGVFSICGPTRPPPRVKADAAGTDTSYVR